MKTEKGTGGGEGGVLKGVREVWRDAARAWADRAGGRAGGRTAGARLRPPADPPTPPTHPPTAPPPALTKVVEHTLGVIRVGGRLEFELQGQVLTQHADQQELVGLEGDVGWFVRLSGGRQQGAIRGGPGARGGRAGRRHELGQGLPRVGPPVLLEHDLPQDDEARLVRGQGKHDEVGVQAVQAVPGVRVPAGAAALLPDVRHDLVLALELGRTRVIGEGTGGGGGGGGGGAARGAGE